MSYILNTFLVIIFIVAIIYIPLFLISKLLRFLFFKKNNEFKRFDSKSENDKKAQYLFMEDGPLWKYKNENERKTLLQDLNVVLEYGENGIKEALIRYGFKPGTKIIDIKDLQV